MIAYSPLVKREVLGVPRGPVITGPAAICMAEGASKLLGAHVAVASTGCAGPARMEGQPVGTVWVGVITPAGEHTEQLLFEGPPEYIRSMAAVAAVRAVCTALQPEEAGAAPPLRSDPTV